MQATDELAKARALNARTQVGRYATPPVLRHALIDFHNRNLAMVPTKELELLHKRLTKNTAGSDVRVRLLLNNATQELAKRVQ